VTLLLGFENGPHSIQPPIIDNFHFHNFLYHFISPFLTFPDLKSRYFHDRHPTSEAELLQQNG
jgi:hypothetical protein